MKFVDLLNAAFVDRKEKNTSYSLRAFARDLQISPASLSGLLRGVKSPSVQVVRKCAIHLRWSDGQVRKVLVELQIHRKLRRHPSPDKVLYLESEFDEQDVSWELFAVYQLSFLEDNSSSVKWLADRLNIDEPEAQKCLNFLLEKKCIEIQNGKMIPRIKPTIVADFISDKLLQAEKKILKRCKKIMSSDRDDLRRGLVHYTLLDPKHLKNLSELMIKFASEVDQIGFPTPSSDLYAVMIQAVPVRDQQ